MKYSMFIRTRVIVLFACLSCAISCPQSHAGSTSDKRDVIKGEYIVKLKYKTKSSSFRSMMFSFMENKLGKASLLAMKPFQTDKRIYKISVADSVQPDVVIKTMKDNPDIQYVEPNYIFHVYSDGIPNDPLFNQQWNMQNRTNPGTDINVLPLWNEGYTGSHQVIVAVIDTGVQWTHPDLTANLYTNPLEGSVPNGIDDDQNGFIDDIHGWNFADNNNNSADDTFNHGTHCAGIIGATGNNGIGVVGVNWNVTILPVQFINGSGVGSVETAVESINYAIKMGVDIMNNSWGGFGYSDILRDTIIDAEKAGILFVASAGNNQVDNDILPFIPCNYKLNNVISVAATDIGDAISLSSNYGKLSTHVAAPGKNILSTLSTIPHPDEEYGPLSGTSMAAPHVAGVAALMKSIHPEWDYREIKRRLIKYSDKVSALNDKVISGGRINAYNAVHSIGGNDEPDPDRDIQWQDAEYALESDHPYGNSREQVFTIHHPGAKYMRVHFEKIDLEPIYDKIFIQDQNGQLSDIIHHPLDGYISRPVKGDTLVVRLRSDFLQPAWGFRVDKYQFAE